MATIFEPETTIRVSCRTLPLPSRAVLTQMTTRFCASANWLKPIITSKKKEAAARIPPPRERHTNSGCPRLLICRSVCEYCARLPWIFLLRHCACLTCGRSAAPPISFCEHLRVLTRRGSRALLWSSFKRLPNRKQKDDDLALRVR